MPQLETIAWFVTHWYVPVGAVVALIVAGVWGIRKVWKEKP